MSRADEGKPVELVDYLRVVRRRWVLVLLAVVVTTATSVGLSLSKDKQYRTTARFNVSAGENATAFDEITRRQLAVQRASAYAQFALTGPAVADAVKAAGYTGGARVGATADAGSPFLSVTVTDRDPKRAAAVANAYMQSLPETVVRLDRTGSSVRQELSALEPAGVPTTPVSPDPQRDGSIGLALGLILGLGAAFLREALDRSYKDPDAVEAATGVAVLGVVPEELPGVELPTVTHSTSGRAEAYRTVRTNIQFSGPEHSLKTIVITSATAGEGKTSIAANLAVAFARTGHSVVLVDADMRRPRVAKAFDLGVVSFGLSEVLNRSAELDDALVDVETNLKILSAGSMPTNPSELLGSTRMSSLLEELAERFDAVLIDSPPILPVTDPLVLAVHATGVVLVVRLGTTSRERIKRALGALKKLDVPLLGIAANGAVRTGDAAYGYGYKYAYGGSGSHG